MTQTNDANAHGDEYIKGFARILMALAQGRKKNSLCRKSKVKKGQPVIELYCNKKLESGEPAEGLGYNLRFSRDVHDNNGRNA